jgi:hypothetical protein
MSAYRRPSGTGPESSRWRLANRVKLKKCGVPGEVAESHRGWIYALLHGDDYLGTGWDVSWITDQQAKELLDLLLANFGDQSGYDLIRLLKRRVGRPD